MFALRGFGKPYWQGTKEAFATFGKLEKPKFRFKNLPNYVLIQFWLIGGFFKYAAYRIPAGRWGRSRERGKRGKP